MSLTISSTQLQKYLSTRGITAPWRIEGTTRDDFRAAIVIPALAEAESLPHTLASLAKNPVEHLQQSLLVVVVNNRLDGTNEQLQDNQQTLAWIRTRPFQQLNLACVDASSSGLALPAKEGVGLARKIGFDLALTRLDKVAHSLLISLDADTLVDENYLPAIFAHFQASHCGGATIPFRHQQAAEPRHEAAIRRYELYLRSYLFGLQQCGSPYAYHTIGSAFACRPEAYVKAGGMNRRQVTEDFYFLQQLAKTSGVEALKGTVVQPSPRFSDRVPFGTGKAMQEQLTEGRMSFQFSSLAAFSVLQAWIRLVESSLESSADDLLEESGQISPVLRKLLLELHFVAVWGKMQINHSDSQQRRAAFHNWFDGLRSRQLLTRLDAEKLHSEEQLVEELLDWGGYPGIRGRARQLALLEHLQHARNNPAEYGPGSGHQENLSE